jgi:voltage-gated potassium channel
MTEAGRRVRTGLALLVAVVVVGTLGYIALGLSVLDAIYQCVTTVFTVGFREVGEVDGRWKVWTIVVIVFGVGTALYTLGVVVEGFVEGQISDRKGRRRMERHIESMTDHVIVCGWGRVGRALAANLSNAADGLVVVDNDPVRLATVGGLYVEGDATDDDVLRRAGIERARALVAAIDGDAANLYVTLSARSLRPDLFIVARARSDTAEAKLHQAGATRVVNPQQIGGARMAALVDQPHVAEFLDVVMHDGSLEFRLEEVPVPDGSPLAGHSLGDARIRELTGALILAMRAGDGTFKTNPGSESTLAAGEVLIAIGTAPQLKALDGLVRGR